ncbi:right-handed parallel beta-helix repeat-containing protein [Mahella australiensis]|uniref:Uncharacterized protein n=1 Tax=Mahella australiensis (strain DSM 15567 / CIP 107919 / 50-1 BON) TaxID=697281 RepID=F4A0T9_MAHA5|nr:right-handed parallel beta-helix repeat-containing protein [Mahella australiensis]AEE96985.1 hypothetical protein Mahau_1804 [Mahella australiensis 50-1 BON]
MNRSFMGNQGDTSSNIYYIATDGDDGNPGTINKPWATIQHAASILKKGDTAYIRGGVYKVNSPVVPKNSGTEQAYIIYSGYNDEKVVIDASSFDSDASSFSIDMGVFELDDVAYICIKNIKIANSHAKGIHIKNSNNIEVVHCTTENTFACGIAMWDTDTDAQHCNNNRIIGNTVIKANTWDMIPKGMKRGNEPPHEAISIAGASNFEVAYNHVYNCDKEGIDVKEVSRYGRVHHNYIHNVDRQGLYADSWFGKLTDVEFDHNVVTECRGAGMAISVEGGQILVDVRIHHNLIYNNYGTGILFGRWGGDGPRKNVNIYNNIIVHNGYGYPGHKELFWITGGIYLFSANLNDVHISNNVVGDNRAFQIGYSDLYLEEGKDIETIFREKGIDIKHNLIYDRNDIEYPIYVGWTGNFAYVYPYNGISFVEWPLEFADEAKGNFYLKPPSLAINNDDLGSERL